ncbi:MAG: hypothetical protein IJE01_00105 [Clostridia bacterium]|nr:hypothetical protein [Clostridia bacterium]
MKKLIYLGLVLIIFMCAVALPVSAATPSLTAKYNQNTAQSKQFEVEISLKNNPGLNGIMITAEYDTNSLSLVSTKNGGLFKTIFTTSQSITVHPYKIMWITTDQNFKEVTNDGVMVTYVFKVKDNAPIGKTNLSFMISDFSDNKNTKKLDFDGVNLTVNINKNSASLNQQEAASGNVDHTSSDTEDKSDVTSSPSEGGGNNVTSKNTSSVSSPAKTESTVLSNNTAQNTSTDPTQSSSLEQEPTKSSSTARPVNANPNEDSKSAPSLMPIILTAIVIVVSGIIGGITLIIKNRR